MYQNRNHKDRRPSDQAETEPRRRGQWSRCDQDSLQRFGEHRPSGVFHFSAGEIDKPNI